jgi:hypothetical protein
MNLFQDLQRAMGSVAGFEETRSKVHFKKSFVESAWQNLGDYLGGILGLWGVLSLVAVWHWRKVRVWSRELHSPTQQIEPGEMFLWCGLCVPVGFFLVLSVFSHIEANWVGMHLMAGAILVVKFWRPKLSFLRNIFLIHLSLAGCLMVMVARPELAPFARNNRIINESAGYDHLVELLRSKISGGVLAVDSYQLKSALAARWSDLATAQWPAITRPSEYTRGDVDDVLVESRLKSAKEFYLLTFENIPPELPGFKAVSLEGIRSCPDGKIAFYSVSRPMLPCEKGLRDWWLVGYQQ